jgi:hypothetical protein
LCKEDTQLSTDKTELCKNIHNIEKDVYSIVKSSVVYIQQLLLLSKTNPEPTSKLCIGDTQLLARFLPRWIELLQKPESLKIVYYLVVNGTCYARGLVKVFGGDSRNVSLQLDILKKYGIAEEIRAEDGDVRRLFAQRKTFRISSWHFDKAIFYRLTPLGKAFFCNVQYEKFLEPHVLQQADKWMKRLEQTHRQLEKEEYNIQRILAIWYCDFFEHRYGKFANHANIQWIEGKLESLVVKHGIVIGKSSRELLDEFLRKHESEKKESENDHE